MWFQLVEKSKLNISGGLNLKCCRPWGGFHPRCLSMGRNTATVLSHVQGWVVAVDIRNSTLWPFAVLGIYCFSFTSLKVCQKGEHKALICCLSTHSFSRNPLQLVAMLSQALVNMYFPFDHGINCFLDACFLPPCSGSFSCSLIPSRCSASREKKYLQPRLSLACPVLRLMKSATQSFSIQLMGQECLLLVLWCYWCFIAINGASFKWMEKDRVCFHKMYVLLLIQILKSHYKMRHEKSCQKLAVVTAEGYYSLNIH